MFTFDKTDAQRLAVSAIGAIALSAACVAGAVAPANAATPSSIGSWKGQVEHRLDNDMDSFSRSMPVGQSGSAVLAVRFTAEGDFAGAEIARSSGNAALDRHAVKVAGQVKYPALPAALQGQPQMVAMRLVFGHPATQDEYVAMTKSLRPTVTYAAADRGGEQVTAR